MSAADLMKAISDGGGKVTLKTASGGVLTAMQKGKEIELTDVNQSNGVIHVIDTVLLP